MSIAITNQWKDKATGVRREESEWHRAVFYGRLAEISSEYLRKGRTVFVEGCLKTRKWQDSDTGTDRYTTPIEPAARPKGRSGKAKASAAAPGEVDTSDIPF